MSDTRIFSLLSLLGSVWLLWLFFSSPDLALPASEAGQERATVSCQPLGSMKRATVSPQVLLTSDQTTALAGYIEQAEADADPERDVRAQIHSTVAAHCEAARLDRLALLGLVGLGTGILVMIAITIARRGPSPDTPKETGEPATAAKDPGA